MSVVIDEKNEIAKRAIMRAKSGLNFLQDIALPCVRSGTDAAYSRSIYVLLSYNMELLLSALFILGSNSNSKSKIINSLKAASKLHNLQSLFYSIPKEFRFGIMSVTRKNVNEFVKYEVKIQNSSIIIEDFIDVRYDFKEGKLRALDKNEGNRLKESVEVLLNFVNNVINNSVKF